MFGKWEWAFKHHLLNNENKRLCQIKVSLNITIHSAVCNGWYHTVHA